MDDEYELLPREDFQNLKKELDKLKKDPLANSKEGDGLKESIDRLNENVKKLIDIFANTESDLAKEYAMSNPIEEMKKIKNQNEQIAQGIVAVADMIKDLQLQSAPPKQDLSAFNQPFTAQLPVSPPPPPMPPLSDIGLPDEPRRTKSFFSGK